MGGKLISWQVNVSQQEKEGGHAADSGKDAESAKSTSGKARHRLVAAVAVQGGKSEALQLPCPLVDAVDSVQFLTGACTSCHVWALVPSERVIDGLGGMGHWSGRRLPVVAAFGSGKNVAE